MKKTDKKKKLSLTLLVVIMALALAFVQLFISHRLATAGEKVRQLEEKSAHIEAKNRLKEEAISQLGSLNAIAQKAAELGYVKTVSVLYLTPQVPVALGQPELSLEP